MMMDLQQIVALTIVAAAAALLVSRYVRARRKPKFGHCADCAAASTHAPVTQASVTQSSVAQTPVAHPPAADDAGRRGDLPHGG